MRKENTHQYIFPDLIQFLLYVKKGDFSYFLAFSNSWSSEAISLIGRYIRVNLKKYV